jgi:hypothetical protein
VGPVLPNLTVQVHLRLDLEAPAAVTTHMFSKKRLPAGMTTAPVRYGYAAASNTCCSGDRRSADGSPFADAGMGKVHASRMKDTGEA